MFRLYLQKEIESKKEFLIWVEFNRFPMRFPFFLMRFLKSSTVALFFVLFLCGFMGFQVIRLNGRNSNSVQIFRGIPICIRWRYDYYSRDSGGWCLAWSWFYSKSYSRGFAFSWDSRKECSSSVPATKGNPAPGFLSHIRSSVFTGWLARTHAHPKISIYKRACTTDGGR